MSEGQCRDINGTEWQQYFQASTHLDRSDRISEIQLKKGFCCCPSETGFLAETEISGLLSVSAETETYSI